MTRRLAHLLAAAVAACGMSVAIGSVPVAAHVCGAPRTAAPKERTTVTVGVGAEADAVVQVDVTVPDGFVLETTEAVDWAVERVGNELRFTGSRIEPASCAYFDLVGTPSRKGTFVFPMRVHYANGLSRGLTSADPNDPYSAQLLYAGTAPSTDEPASAGSGGGGSRVATTVVVLGAVGLAVWWGIRKAGVKPA